MKKLVFCLWFSVFFLIILTSVSAQCTPQEQKCYGNDIWQCNDLGEWINVDTCPPGEICKSQTPTSNNVVCEINRYLLFIDDSVTVEGKTVTLLNVGSAGSVLLDIDGTTYTISGTEIHEGLVITVVDFGYSDILSERWALLEIVKATQRCNSCLGACGINCDTFYHRDWIPPGQREYFYFTLHDTRLVTVTVDPENLAKYDLSINWRYNDCFNLYSDSCTPWGPLGMLQSCNRIVSPGTYYVMIEHYGSGVGGYSLNITCMSLENRTQTCEDSDGGLDYYSKGSVTVCTYNDTGGGCGKFVDICKADSILREGYCENNDLKTVRYACPYGCLDGACINETTTTIPTTTTTIPPTPTCEDSDGGINYYVEGYVDVCTYTETGGSCSRAADFCDDNILTEGYCENNDLKSVKYTCPYGCSPSPPLVPGACVYKIASCNPTTINPSTGELECPSVSDVTSKVEKEDGISVTISDAAPSMVLITNFGENHKILIVKGKSAAAYTQDKFCLLVRVDVDKDGLYESKVYEKCVYNIEPDGKLEFSFDTDTSRSLLFYPIIGVMAVDYIGPSIPSTTTTSTITTTTTIPCSSCPPDPSCSIDCGMATARTTDLPIGQKEYSSFTLTEPRDVTVRMTPNPATSAGPDYDLYTSWTAGECPTLSSMDCGGAPSGPGMIETCGATLYAAGTYYIMVHHYDIVGNGYSLKLSCRTTTSTITTTTATTTTTTPVCTGNIDLTLSPNPVEVSSNVHAEVRGTYYCGSLPKKDSCDGEIACERGSGCGQLSGGENICDCDFTSPSVPGSYTYYACVDKNSDGDYDDSGETDSKILNVIPAGTKITVTPNAVCTYSTSSAGGYGHGYYAGIISVGTYLGTDGIAHYKSAEMNFRLDVPQGATITSARLIFTAAPATGYRQSNARREVNTRITAPLVDNLEQCSKTGYYEIRYLSKTSAFVDWDDIDPWIEGEVYSSPDISNVIQEIVDQPGWSPGNTLGIVWGDHGSTLTRAAFVFRQGYGLNQGDNTVKLEVTFIPPEEPVPLGIMNAITQFFRNLLGRFII